MDMSRIDEINKMLSENVYEGNVYTNIANDVQYLLSQLFIVKQTLETIGNITHRQDDIILQEINRHVDDALESFE
jgi:hypothetical protein